MFWLDSALRLTWVNRAWEALTGISAETVLGRSIISHEAADADLVAGLVPPPEAIAGQPSGSLIHIKCAGSEPLRQRVEFWPFRGSEGTLIGLLGQLREPDSSPSVPDSKALKVRTLLAELRVESRRSLGVESIIGTGPAHRRVLDQIRLAAGSMIPVLVVGEPGAGKRHVAGAIHQLGARRNQPLIPIDCEALSPETLERELFRPPAVGGQPASQAAPPPPAAARFICAEGSTLVMGDILTLPRDLQGRLVEALDGDVRLIATTAGDPEAALRTGRLRVDLYHAITPLVLRLDPLRHRRHDLALLAQHFLERANERWGRYRAGFTPAAMDSIEAYDWPGNLRELARVIDSAHLHARSKTAAGQQHGGMLIDVDDLPASIRGNLGAAYLPPAAARPLRPLDELLTEIERRLIETALIKARQNKSRAADLLGISRPRLYRRIKELNLPDDPEAEVVAAEPQARSDDA